MSAGSCFGFEVHSDLALRYLRDGGDTSSLTIDIAGQGPGGAFIGAWAPSPEAPTLDARLHESPGGYRLWVGGEGGGWFEIEPVAGRVGVPPDVPEVRREERLWGIPAALCFLAQGDLSLHAAAIEVEGAAVLIAAPSRFGKTTLAGACAAHGLRLLSEDLCRLQVDGDPRVIPGPAMLRLRHDVADALDIDGAEVLARDDDRVHLALPVASRGSCDPLPLRAIVLLYGESERIELTELAAPAALADLWALSLRLPGEQEAARCFAGASALAASVPVYGLVRPITFASLAATVEAVAGVG
jgi:hypothetical protein